MSILYLIRHGQASFGSSNYDKLSELGEEQAKILGTHFAEVHEGFDAIYHGNMERQRKTADLFIEAANESGEAPPKPILEGAFDEYDAFKVWEQLLPTLVEEEPSIGHDLQKIREDSGAFERIFERVMLGWVSGGYDQHHTDLPRWSQFCQRVEQGIDGLLHRHGPGEKVAVFTSGGTISVTVRRALGMDHERTMQLSWQIMNASVTRLKFGEKGLILSGFNDVSHFEKLREERFFTYR